MFSLTLRNAGSDVVHMLIRFMKKRSLFSQMGNAEERECEALVIFFLLICISYNKEAVKVSPIVAARGIDQLD